MGGWAAWGVFGKYLYTTSWAVEVAPHYALYVAIITIFGMIVSLPLRYLYRFLWNRAIWVQAIGLLGGSAIVRYLWIKFRSYYILGLDRRNKGHEGMVREGW